uniref:Uncharacterized protein n=1 Tax=Rhizophora mucronata TaxID=61149 RepID=A0A2P2PAU4_RHIMU
MRILWSHKTPILHLHFTCYKNLANFTLANLCNPHPLFRLGTGNDILNVWLNPCSWILHSNP